MKGGLLLPTGSGAVLAGVVLDHWSSSAPTADVSLALLLLAGILFVMYVWLEARSSRDPCRGVFSVRRCRWSPSWRRR